MIVEIEQGYVGNGDDVLARIAIWLAEGIELLEKSVVQAGLLATCSVIDRFARVYETAWDRPLTFERLDSSFDEQYLEIGAFGIKFEDDTVEGQRGAGVIVSGGHGSGLGAMPQPMAHQSADGAVFLPTGFVLALLTALHIIAYSLRQPRAALLYSGSKHETKRTLRGSGCRLC